jgi:Ca-activated chloride channel homolog
MFRFAYPGVFLLLLIPIALKILAYRRGWKALSPVLMYSDLRLIYGLPIGWRVRFRHIPDILRGATWLILVIALSRPQGGQSQQMIRGQGIDIVLVLDISGSMSALDFAPQNRLEAAKRVIRNFISGRSFDPIGLVVFSQDAFQQVPPTLDYNTLLRSLDKVRLAPVYGLDDGTAIGLGIASAGNMLRTSSATSKIIILLTDGANNAGGIGPVTAAEAVAAFDIRVYTIGVGKTGLIPIPVDNVGHTQFVESDLDEPTLQIIAQVSRGQYFRAQDLIDLQSVYSQIDQLERSDVQREVLVRWQEQAGLFLWLGFATLTFERFLRQTVFQTIP